MGYGGNYENVTLEITFYYFDYAMCTLLMECMYNVQYTVPKIHQNLKHKEF